jgi:histidine ammonia-lyase
MPLNINAEHVKYEELCHCDEVAISKDETFRKKVEDSHRFLLDEIAKGKPIYGVTTGYGESGKNYSAFEEAKELQKNLFRFHGCGVGDYLSHDECKRILLIRLTSLSKGYSGVTVELLERMALLYNNDIIPRIPSQGSVGASGDLTPLSYIAAVIAGEREVYYKGEVRSAADVYAELGIEAREMEPKESLAIMNGTATMSGIAIEAMMKFENWLHAYESFIAGLFEVMHADGTPLQPLVHEVKPFSGQIRCAAQIAEKLIGSEIVHAQDERYEKFFEHEELCIQDKYSIRCTPQVLGIVWDNLEMSKKWVETECNAVNDNPIIDGEGKKIYTSGNFYGGYVAHAMDTLKICSANAADLLDKQFSLVVDHKFNRGIGENLKLSDKAYHHGFKAMQITLSSLSADVMMNIVPASVFSRPTESLNQDKVSMGTTAALNFKRMLPDLDNMLAIAFMGLAQAVDIRSEKGISPHLQKIYKTIRAEIDPLVEDRRMDIEIEKVVAMIRNGALS